jgi:hypothetical protein
MTKHLLVAVVLVAFGTATPRGAAQQLVTSMDTNRVEEAFRLAADERRPPDSSTRMCCRREPAEGTVR